MKEHTIFLLKPEAVIRRYVGARVLKQVMKLNPEVRFFQNLRLSRQFLQDVHYAEHKGKDFFAFLIDYMSTNQTSVVILSGEDLASRVRELLGPTKPEEAALKSPLSLRARYGIFGSVNCAHASENALRGSVEVSNFKKHLGLVEETKAKDALEKYVDAYIDWPYVDSVRYREISFALAKGQIESGEAKSKFLNLLGKESTLHSRTELEKMADIMVKNCARNVSVVQPSPFY